MGARGAAVLVMVLSAGILAACGTTTADTSAASSGPPRTRTDTSRSTLSTSSSASSSGSGASTGLGMALAAIDPAKLPATRAAVASVMGKLPATLNGHPVSSERTWRTVRYADGTSVEATSLVEAAGQGFTMDQFWPHLEAGHPGDFAVTSHSKPGDRVRWLTGDGQPPYHEAVVAAVTPSNGPWLFAIEAPSEKAANDVLTAFQAALG